MPTTVWASVVPAVLAETRPLRAALHHCARTHGCGLRIPDPNDDRPLGGQIGGDCVCRDFLVDMLVEAHLLLVGRAGELRNPAGAVRTHLRMRAIGDWIRRRRTEMGAQARCDRIRRGARARALPDEYHRAVLEYLVDEAGSPAPLDGHEELVLRLAARAAAEFGGSRAEHHDRVAAALRVAERVCSTGPRVNLGTAHEPEFVTWWERFIEQPLGRRPRRYLDPLPDASGTAPVAVAPVGPPPTTTDDQVIDHLVAAVRRHPGSPEAALREGLAELVSDGLLPARTAASALADRSRITAATRELSTLACR